MTKAEALVTNYNKSRLAEMVVELTEKLEEMKTVEAQVGASFEELKSGAPAVGMTRKEDGTYRLVRIVYDLSKNAAAISTIEDYGKDHQIATGKIIREAGEISLKASGNMYYK